MLLSQLRTRVALRRLSPALTRSFSKKESASWMKFTGPAPSKSSVAVPITTAAASSTSASSSSSRKGMTPWMKGAFGLCGIALAGAMYLYKKTMDAHKSHRVINEALDLVKQNEAIKSFIGEPAEIGFVVDGQLNRLKGTCDIRFTLKGPNGRCQVAILAHRDAPAVLKAAFGDDPSRQEEWELDDLVVTLINAHSSTVSDGVLVFDKTVGAFVPSSEQRVRPTLPQPQPQPLLKALPAPASSPAAPDSTSSDSSSTPSDSASSWGVLVSSITQGNSETESFIKMGGALTVISLVSAFLAFRRQKKLTPHGSLLNLVQGMCKADSSLVTKFGEIKVEMGTGHVTNTTAKFDAILKGSKGVAKVKVEGARASENAQWAFSRLEVVKSEENFKHIVKPRV